MCVYIYIQVCARGRVCVFTCVIDMWCVCYCVDVHNKGVGCECASMCNGVYVYVHMLECLY